MVDSFLLKELMPMAKLLTLIDDFLSGDNPIAGFNLPQSAVIPFLCVSKDWRERAKHWLRYHSSHLFMHCKEYKLRWSKGRWIDGSCYQSFVDEETISVSFRGGRAVYLSAMDSIVFNLDDQIGIDEGKWILGKLLKLIGHPEAEVYETFVDLKECSPFYEYNVTKYYKYDDDPCEYKSMAIPLSLCLTSIEGQDLIDLGFTELSIIHPVNLAAKVTGYRIGAVNSDFDLIHTLIEWRMPEWGQECTRQFDHFVLDDLKRKDDDNK